ncbi:hypothetical protein [Paraburkholderia sp. 35.1]|uniref:hypothetical protein n=1 Tax=Paraburkholderia sp. 35.1 TaxID=2991058 RepID=UPI003D221EC7
MRFAHVLPALPLLCTLVACNQTNQADVAAATKKIDELGSQVTSLSRQLEESKATIANLQGQVSILQITTQGIWEASPFVILDPTTRSYAVVKTNLGQLLVSVVDFSPYLNGYKLKLAIGNPSFVTYNGAKLTVRWGTSAKWETPGFDAAKWQQGLQSKETSVTNTLLPGAWNQVELVVAPASADQTGYLAVSISLDQVSLRQM